MAKLNGHLPPVTRALWDSMLDAWAQPGMNNLSDLESPTGAIGDADPDVLAAAVKRDDRSQAQRNHDAMHVLLVSAMKEGVLGNASRPAGRVDHQNLPARSVGRRRVCHHRVWIHHSYSGFAQCVGGHRGSQRCAAVPGGVLRRHRPPVVSGAGAAVGIDRAADRVVLPHRW
ncbi:DUF222 domain-containing protein [Gordonia oleivorans]|uniref:DUF222 domain-containing protein n=1 Tax=Gordonia oleivorans TaxID=3156618 RepID=UPI003CCDFB53